MPGWQKIYEELKDNGLVVITVALDKSAEDARPWIEAAAPTHPSLIDTCHLLADLFGMVNVPTVVWIDEAGKIAHPNDVAFTNDRQKQLTGLTAGVHLEALRRWVQQNETILTPEEILAYQSLPTAEEQEARAWFALGRWLYDEGFVEAAAQHFMRAGSIAPEDFTIRRGTMPMRNIDPMGPEFVSMLEEWKQGGNSYYRPLEWQKKRQN